MSITSDSHGRGPKPSPYRATVNTVRLTPAERALAERLAKHERTSLSDILRSALADYHTRSDC